MDWCRARVTAAIDLKSALVAAFEVGKRTEVQARRLVKRLKNPCAGMVAYPSSHTVMTTFLGRVLPHNIG